MLARAVVFSVVLFAVGRMLLAADAQPPVLTVCEALTDPDRYDGKSVIMWGGQPAPVRELGWARTAV